MTTKHDTRPAAIAELEEQGGAATQGQRPQQTTKRNDSLTVTLTDQAEPEFTRASERAAKVRCALRCLSGGGYMLTRTSWGLYRELPDLRAVFHVLALMEG